MTHIIILMGPPGAGKGSVAQKLSAEKKLPHISTGSLLREEIAKGSELGEKVESIMQSGQLVDDATVIALLKERISQDDCKNGFILDGFPRTPPQAEALELMFHEMRKSDPLVLYIQVNEETVVKRISGRKECSGCGKIYHDSTMPPKKQGVCDDCEKPLIQRHDDIESVVRERFSVYQQKTAPLIAHYEQKGLLRSVNGNPMLPEVMDQVFKVLEQF
jgi:adenylate kinase